MALSPAASGDHFVALPLVVSDLKVVCLQSQPGRTLSLTCLLDEVLRNVTTKGVPSVPPAEKTRIRYDNM